MKHMRREQIGINGHLAAGPQMDLIAGLGVGWVRLDFNWYDIEPERRRYDFRVTEASVNAALVRGLNVYATLSYVPGWANGGRERNHPPNDPRDWANFVHTTVEHFNSRVCCWGMWNEPNSEGMLAASVDDYIESILIPGVEAATYADPFCTVCGPELAHMEDWREWATEVLCRARSYIDVVTHHCYPRRDGRELYRIMEDYPDTMGRPLWVTEVGFRSERHGEEGQADRFDQLLEAFPSQKKIAGLILYDLMSVVRDDLSLKPAYEVIKNRIEGGHVS